MCLVCLVCLALGCRELDTARLASLTPWRSSGTGDSAGRPQAAASEHRTTTTAPGASRQSVRGLEISLEAAGGRAVIRLRIRLRRVSDAAALAVTSQNGPSSASIGPVNGEPVFFERLLQLASRGSSAPSELAPFLRGTYPTSPAVESAVLNAATAPTPGHAVAAAHQAALHQLVPRVAADGGEIRAVCVTEAAGNSPRDIKTCLSESADGWSMSGSKRWATLSPLADQLLVVALRGWHGHRADLVVVAVPAARTGITIRPLRDTGDPLGLPHAEVHFADVAVHASELVVEDAHDRLVKPMRLLEDLFGAAVASACRLKLAITNDWPRDHAESELALIAAIRQLSQDPAGNPACHLASAGVLSLARTLEARARELARSLDEETRAHWTPFLESHSFAARAREARRARAWATLFEST